MADAPRRPTAADLAALGTDAWSALLAIALPVVRQLPELHVDATVKRVASLPPGRLAAGRSRRDLAQVLVRDPVWDRVVAALPEGATPPWEDTTGPDDDSDDTGDPEVDRLRQRVGHLEEREQTLADKVASLRAEVGDLQRERDGAVARAERAEAAEQAALADRDEARAAAAAADEDVAAADERVAREVARMRRRDHGEVARLREDLRTVRRERDELRAELSRARDQAAARSAAAAAPVAAVLEPDDSGGRRGRPSRFPEGIVAGTRRAAEWLVAEGRVLLVDGYNVTRTHRADLSLAEQRRWLEQAVTALARRRHVDATIVWDSTMGRPTTRRPRSGVTVRFTPQGVTADDELVLHVQLALDPDTPVVVVTDDVELRGRLAEHGVDLLDSQSFTWLL